MLSLQKASTQMSDRNRKGKDHFNSTLVFPVDDSFSGSNKDEKRKEVLECSSRSSVSETEESLLTSSPLETNSSPVQPEKQSRNGASSLLDFWEARSQQPSSSQSQSLIHRRISAGLSLLDNLSAVSKSLNDKTKYNKNGEEKERDFLGMVTCTPRIRGKQAFEDLFTKILDDRKEELESIANKYRVSEFSPSRCSRLELMLRIRCLERCIAVQERHRFKRRYKKNIGKVAEAGISSSSVSSREKKVEKLANKAVERNVLQEKTEEVKETMEKSDPREATRGIEIAKKFVERKDTSNKNGLKIERDATEVGETVAKESVEGNKTSLSIAEKVNIWEYSNSKDRTNWRETTEKSINEEKTARVTNVEATEREKEEVSSLEQGKPIETEEYQTSPQEVISTSFSDERKEEETRCHVSSESGQEEETSQDNEETTNAKKLERLETLCMILESPSFLNGWDENEMEEGEEYSEESVDDDWVSEISKPRSHWEDLRAQREFEVMEKAEKKEFQNMIKKRIVSSMLASDLREEIEKIIISLPQRRLQVESNPVEEQDREESLVECSESYPAKLEGNETVDLETVSDGFSQSSSRGTMMRRSLEDHEAPTKVSSKDHDNTSSEFEIICGLQEQIKQLQIEMIQLRGLVESHIDSKKSVELESVASVDICERV